MWRQTRRTSYDAVHWNEPVYMVPDEFNFQSIMAVYEATTLIGLTKSPERHTFQCSCTQIYSLIEGMFFLRIHLFA